MALKNRKLWLIPAGLLLTAAIFALIFWQTLIVYIAPRMVLAGALKARVSQLQSRFSSGPISVLASGVDPEGKNQIDLQLDTYNDLAGAVRYEMQVQLEQNPRRLLADGKAIFKSAEMDLSLYLDSTFAAVSSQGILGGNYYGLTYDSFSEDIRSNKLAALLIGEKTLSSWETTVRTLQDVMEKDTPKLPDISGIDAEALIMGVLALDVDVERVRIDLNSEDAVYQVISFETSGTEIASVLKLLGISLSSMPAAGEEIEWSFWLKDRKLCKLEIDTDIRSLDIYWGTAAVSFLPEDDIYIEFFDGTDFKTCKVHTEQRDGLYRETFTYTGAEKIQISYDWAASTGDLKLSVDTKGETRTVALKLAATENGFTVETEDFGALMRLLTGAPDTADNPCSMTVRKGSDFETPAYKNFIDWSVEDLLTLLSGFGHLLGLDLQ